MDRHHIEVYQSGTNQGVAVTFVTEPIDKLGHQIRYDLVVWRRVHAADSHGFTAVFATLVVLKPREDLRVQAPQQLLRPLEVGAKGGAVRDVQGGVVVPNISNVCRIGGDRPAGQNVFDLLGGQGIALDARASCDGGASGGRPDSQVCPPMQSWRSFGRDRRIPGANQVVNGGRALKRDV